MSLTINDKDLGFATAYAYAVSKGYTGTEEEFAELMASYATVAEQAEESAEDSEAYAVGKRGGVDVGTTDETYHNNSKYYAAQAAADASTSSSAASAASRSEQNAAASASAAAQSATDAAASKNTAAESASTAAGHATNAASSATAASGSATAAANSATAAGDAKTAAETAQGKAEDAQEAAEQAQSDAEAAAQSVSQSAAQISQNASDISDLKSAINTLRPTATAQDVGKALIVKTVDPQTGKPTSYEYGEAGGDTVAEKLLANIIPGTTQTVTFDANSKPATVVFSENGSAVRTDAFTWGNGTVTEVRTLSSGEYITMATDFTTLVTTMSKIQRGA